MDDKLKIAVENFLSAFESVFDKDWIYTKEMLGIIDDTKEQAKLEGIHIISPDGTFLNPKTDDEVVNWGFREKLLSEYCELKKLLE